MDLIMQDEEQETIITEEAEALFSPSIEMNREAPKPPALSSEDKERFYKSILSDKPYEETVPLFDGQLNITFRSLLVKENTDVVNQIGLDRKNGIAADNDAYLVTLSAYRMAVSLIAANGEPFSALTRDTFTPSHPKDTYVLAKSLPVFDWATPKLSAYLDAFAKFETKVVRLASEVQTPNFWKASA